MKKNKKNKKQFNFKKVFLPRNILKHKKEIKEIFAGIVAFLALVVMAFSAKQYSDIKKAENTPVPTIFVPNKKNKVLDTSDWKTYKDGKYNFEIKYPPCWTDPRAKIINDKDFVYQYEVDFGTEATLNGDDNEGYSIYVNKRDSSDENIDLGECIASQSGIQTNESGVENECLLYKLKESEEGSQYYSYQFIGKDFEYNLVPALKGDSSLSSVKTKSLPQFEAASNTFTLDFEAIEAIKKKNAEKLRQQAIAAAAAAEKARIIAQYKPSTRKLVCVEKNIRPSKSDAKGKHIDEDCCPDPDEWPNLRCHYKPSDYNIMLKGSPPDKLLKKR